MVFHALCQLMHFPLPTSVAKNHILPDHHKVLQTFPFQYITQIHNVGIYLSENLSTEIKILKLIMLPKKKQADICNGENIIQNEM